MLQATYRNLNGRNFVNVHYIFIDQELQSSKAAIVQMLIYIHHVGDFCYAIALVL